VTDKIYTGEQLRCGKFDPHEVFGCVLCDPLPFRLIGFSENGIPGAFRVYRYCAKTLEPAWSRAACCHGPVAGVYELQADGCTWHLHKSPSSL